MTSLSSDSHKPFLVTLLSHGPCPPFSNASQTHPNQNHDTDFHTIKKLIFYPTQLNSAMLDRTLVLVSLHVISFYDF